MMKMLLAAVVGIAAIAVAAPASAQEFNDSHHSGHGSRDCGLVMGRHHDANHRDGVRGNIRCAHSDVIMDWYGGEWALYNNRSWDPDSYNDWWHDRPNRAYPHWMTTNQDCQRRWFAGDVLRC